MHADERFEDLLIRLEELAKNHPSATVEELVAHDVSLASAIRRDPGILDRLQAGIESLRDADRRMGLESEPDPLPEIPGFSDFQEIGRGGMGVVYRAYQPSLKRSVAIKLMLAGPLSDSALRTRFRGEMESAARLRHPNIIEVYETGETQGTLYGCIEYLSGENLKDTMAAGPTSPRVAAECIAKLARAVEYAHRQGIVHRDLKPANVLCTESGTLKIADFGLAKDLLTPQGMTQSGELLGSPSYMAPEQVEGRGVGTATDIYALGVILYEMLTGRPPFLGGTCAETLLQVSTRDPFPPHKFRQGLSRDLEAVCLKCLEKDPRRRYASAAALADDLQRWLDGRVTLARPAGMARRAVKFCRRRPVIAALAVVSCIALFSLGILSCWHDVQMRRSYQLEKVLRDDAMTSAREAIAEKRKSTQLLYVAKVWHAYEAWKTDSMHSFLNLHRELQALKPPADRGTFPHRYLDRLTHLDEITLRNDSPHLFVARFLDDETIISGDQTGMIRVWNRTTGKILREFAGHAGCVNSFDILPDGRLLASASCDETIAIWNLADLSLRQRLPSPSGAVGEVEFLGDGSSLVSNGIDHQVWLWDLRRHRAITRIPFFEEVAAYSTLGPQGDWLATVHGRGHVRWWPRSDPATATSVVLPSKVRAMVFNHAGDQIAAGGDTHVWLWNTHDASCGKPFGLNRKCQSLTFSHDDTMLAVATDDLVIRLWDVKTRRLLRDFKGYDGNIYDLSFSPTDAEIVAASDNGQAKVWRVDGPRDCYRAEVELSGATRAVFSPHAQWLAAVDGNRGDGNRSISLRRLKTPETVKQVVMTGGIRVEGVSFSADGSMMMARWFDENIARHCVWDLSSGEAVLCTDRKGGYLFDVTGAGRWLAVGGATNTELLIEPLDGEGESRRFTASEQIIFCRFDPEGESLLIGTAGPCFLWNLSAQFPQPIEREGGGWPEAFSFSPGKKLVAWACGGYATLYRRSDQRIHATLLGDDGRANVLAFSPDGKILATGGSGDPRIHLWHTLTGQEIMVLEGHSGGIDDLEFSSDGKTLYSLGPVKGHGTSVLCWPTEW